MRSFFPRSKNCLRVLLEYKSVRSVMSTLLLYVVVFFAGMLADSGEKKGNGIDVTEDPFFAVDDYDNVIGHNRFYNDMEDYDFSFFEKDHKNIKVVWPPPELPEISTKFEERSKNLFVNIGLKILGYVMILFILVVVCSCIKCLCKKKRQTVASNPEETVPALSPISNITQSQPYPQQPVAYPLSQMNNLSTPCNYTPLQQNALYKTQSYPTEPYPSEPYPTQPYPNEPYPTEPYPTQPYPVEPYPTEPYRTQPYPAPPYSTGPILNPPAPGFK